LSLNGSVNIEFEKQRLRISCLFQILLNDIPSRNEITVGMMVQKVQKQDQRTGNLTDGKVKKILTSSYFHPCGIKVELDGEKIGPVQKII
jgi:uncharacterized repeat protein (TIGR03833 family)